MKSQSLSHGPYLGNSAWQEEKRIIVQRREEDRVGLTVTLATACMVTGTWPVFLFGVNSSEFPRLSSPRGEDGEDELAYHPDCGAGMG